MSKQSIISFFVGAALATVLTFAVTSSQMYTEQQAVDAGAQVANEKIEEYNNALEKSLYLLKKCKDEQQENNFNI